MNGTELRSFSDFQILTKIAYTQTSAEIFKFTNSKFVFIHCKTVKISPNDQTQLFTGVFLMKGTELRSFSNFQILT